MRQSNLNDAALCRMNGHTCGACCWGADVDRATLEKKLARQRRLAAGWFSLETLPGASRLLVHEVRARFGWDLLLAVLLRIPWLGQRIRRRLAKRVVCAFVAFEDGEHQRVGCLLHPSLWNGRDVRPAAAFRLLPGFGCGRADYACGGCSQFQSASLENRRAILHQLQDKDWYDYSLAVAALSTPNGEPAHAGDCL